MGVGDRDYMNSRRRPSGSHEPSGGNSFPKWLYVAGALFLVVALWSNMKRSGPPEEGWEDLDASGDVRERTDYTGMGTFDVKSGKLAVADPGLTSAAVAEGRLAMQLTAASGEWKARTGKRMMAIRGHIIPDGPLVELQAIHSSITDPAALEWKPEGEIEVHGSVVGTFDAATFRQDSQIPDSFKWNHPPVKPEERWYSACVEACLGLESAGTLPGGATANTDRGKTKVRTARNAEGTVIAVSIRISDLD